MAKVRATLTVEIERGDGSRSVITESDIDEIGDNPRFEAKEAKHMAGIVTDAVLDRMGANA